MARTLVDEPGAEAEVRVVAPDGWEATYHLTPTDLGALPTGIDLADRGTAAGVVADRRPVPYDAGIDAPTWLVPGVALVAQLPGAGVRVALDDGATPPTVEQAAELLAALVPVDLDLWRAGIATVGTSGARVEWGATLGDSVVRLDQSFGTTSTATDGADTTMPASEPPPTGSTSASAPAGTPGG